jgi:hypothetical protein
MVIRCPKPIPNAFFIRLASAVRSSPSGDVALMAFECRWWCHRFPIGRAKICSPPADAGDQRWVDAVAGDVEKPTSRAARPMASATAWRLARSSPARSRISMVGSSAVRGHGGHGCGSVQ